MNEPIFTKTEGARTVKIYYDDDPMPPWDWDLFGTLIHWHPDYGFPDFAARRTPDEFREWAKENDAIMLPVYLYDHSGLRMSTSDFLMYDSGGWDSGQIGYIYVTRAEVLEEWSRRRMSAKLRQLVIENLRGVVEVIDQYLSGNVYGFVIEDARSEIGPEIIHSCWGFYGYEPEKLADLALAGEV